MAAILTVQRTMQSTLGKLPPLNPVPEPRVTTASFAVLAYLRISLTSWVLETNATHPGICCMAAVPSKEYEIKSSFSVRTFWGPTNRRKFSINSSRSIAERMKAVPSVGQATSIVSQF